MGKYVNAYADDSFAETKSYAAAHSEVTVFLSRSSVIEI
jgi:hypothetical protein